MRALATLSVFAAGLLLGFLARGFVKELPLRPAPAGPTGTERASPAGEPAPVGPAIGTAAEVAPARLAPFESGTPDEILAEADYRRGCSAAEVAAIVARLDGARRERDGALFSALLYALAKADRPEAEEKLVALLEDADLMPPPGASSYLCWGLEGSADPRIAPAARARYEAEIAAHPDLRANDDWLALVAAHGGPADIAWLVDLSGSEDGGPDVARILVRTKNPAVRPAIEDLAERGGLEPRLLIELARRQPDLAAPPLARLIGQGEASDGTRMADLLGAWGRAVPADRLDEAAALLATLAAPPERVVVPFFVGALERRGLPIDRFETWLLEPVLFLERLSPKADARTIYDAACAIEACGAIREKWPDRALDALRHAAGTTATEWVAKHLRETIARLSAREQDPWR